MNGNNTVGRKNNTVYIIAGQTCTGKSTVAYYLAKRINGEIVNCDSVQIYKYMDIGSAKPDKKQMEQVPHHLYDFVDPRDNFTVAQYQKLALDTIDDILDRGKTPILVGGTGLYLNSVLYKMDFAAKPVDMERRKELEAIGEQQGSQYLHQLLSAVDPDAAARIHPNNMRKIVRAIEAYELGDSIDPMNKLQPNDKYEFRFFALTMDREWLYTRINRRAIKLMRSGLIDEVKRLKAMGLTADDQSMKSIGYKETLKYLDGEIDLKEAVYEIMRNTRRFAKRQMTWLKRYDDVNWVEIRKGEAVSHVLDQILAGVPEAAAQK